MLCKNILVTGANRGLGLEIVKQLVESPTPPKRVIAACRSPEKAELLQNLKAKHSQIVKLVKLDVSNDSFDEFNQEISDILGSEGLNVLYNNAGICNEFSSLENININEFEDHFRVNALAPFFITKSLLPLLKTASSQQTGSEMNIRRAAVVNVTSRYASIADNESSGVYSYRASKCALNSLSKSLSIDLKKFNILVVAIHPGWCNTSMGGKEAPLTPEESSKNILKNLKSLSNGHTGTFMDLYGNYMPW